ncbi:RusA family crossover junction endodeoxyribonuclease, partial [Arthrospira platensis SPKY1]|nr:RusA family crossover junction endodeoxyribonuclease [Arthrospira platensis SPKY1]
LWAGRPPLDCPVRVDVWFIFDRPKSHFGTGRNADVLKPSAPKRMTTPPDVDKLARTVLDALTVAGVLADDKLVCELRSLKRYAWPNESGAATDLMIHWNSSKTGGAP